MTSPKPPYFRANMGRKSRRIKKHQDKFLKLLFDAGDVTPWNASLYVKCGYAYARKKYFEFEANLTPSQIISRLLLIKKQKN